MHVSSSSSDKTTDSAGDGSSNHHRRQRLALDAGAGALAGAVSRFLVSPLDVVKIRFQVQLEPIAWSSSSSSSSSSSGSGGAGASSAAAAAAAASGAGGAAAAGAQPLRPSHYHGFLHAFRTIVAEEGIKGLWQGTVPGLLLTVPYTAVQFVALQQCKQAAAKLGWEGKSSAAVSFASGAVAGSVATVASYPFDLLRTTLAAQGEPKVYSGMVAAASTIYQQQGVAGLYRGLGVTLIEIIPYAALQFGLYDAFSQGWDVAAQRARSRRRQQLAQQQRHGKQQQQLQHGKQQQQCADDAAPAGWLDNKRLQAFSCGLVAGLLAKLGSHPLDVAKKRYQVAGLPRSLRYGERVQPSLAVMPLMTCLADIHRREGLPGLWKGSVPSVVKAAPAAAITFAAYETLISALLAWRVQQEQQQQQLAAAKNI